MKRIASLLAGVVLASGLTACGGGSSNQTYYPSAYGENGRCYYIDSPLEVASLQRAGLCPSSWIPYPAPGYWHDRYYAYYASPSYYNTYAPAQYRSTWASKQQAYYAPRTSQILAAEKVATYKGSNGKVVTGDKIGVTKYGSGSRTKFGSGSSCKSLGKPGEPVVQYQLDAFITGTGGGSRTGGGGGGGSRGGGGGGSAPKVGGGGARPQAPAPKPRGGVPAQAPAKNGTPPKLHTGC